MTIVLHTYNRMKFLTLQINSLLAMNPVINSIATTSLKINYSHIAFNFCPSMQYT